MSKRHRSFLFASLLPAFLVVSAFAVLQAQEGKSTAAKPARWSDPATWPDRQVPRAGDKVTIAAGKDVVLDVSPPALNGLTIDGKLSFANTADLELTTEWVMVHGELEIGTEARPHTRKATITLTDNVKGEDIGVPAATVASERVDRGIMLMGGTLNLHGNRTNSWTKLSKTAEAGGNTIEVLNAASWRAGDVIVLVHLELQAVRRVRIVGRAPAAHGEVVGGNRLRFPPAASAQQQITEAERVGRPKRDAARAGCVLEPRPILLLHRVAPTAELQRLRQVPIDIFLHLHPGEMP